MRFSAVPEYFAFFIPFFAVGFGISLLIFPSFIKKLKSMQWGQQVREDGPADHLSKKGTPTMGGAVIVLTFIISSLLLYFLHSFFSPVKFGFTTDYFMFAILIFVNALLGFTDDYLKIKKHQSLGLRARDKTLVDIILGALIAWYMINYSAIGSKVLIPFVGMVDFGWFLYPFCAFVVFAFVNSVNLTDGLDGLAGGTVSSTLAAGSLILLSLGKADLFVGTIAILGSILAFLIFNVFPARVFMGDTGSLALGGAIAAISILTGTEFIFAIMGAVYVVESLSVMIQVAYFKKTGGKRIFRMSPIHHHFTLKPRHEVRVTFVFIVVSIWCSLIGLFLYFR